MLLFIILIAENFIVNKIKFLGNTTFSDKELAQIIRTKKGNPYDEFEANMDKNRIIRFYKNKGFREVNVTFNKKIINLEKRLIEWEMNIEEGGRTHIKEIKIEGNEKFTDKQIFGIIKSGKNKPLDEECIFIDKCNIADFYANNGYLYTEVDHQIIEIAPYEVELVFKINEYQKVFFGDIRIEGRERVRGKIIRREITFKKGEIYSPKKLYESQAKIYATELFESVKFTLEGISEKKDTVDVIFSVVETKPRWVSTGGGYSSSHRGMRSWGEIGWGHQNLWNNGQIIGIKIKSEINPFNLKDIKIGELNIKYSEPYLLSTKFRAEFSPFYKIEKKDIDTTQYLIHYMGAQGKIGRYIRTCGQSYISYNYERIRVERKKGKIPETPGIKNSIIFSISWDDRDNVFYPRRGNVSYFLYEYGGGILGGDFNFRKYEGSFTLYSKVPKWRGIIASRIKIGKIFGKVPRDDKFVLGGIHTIRGYRDMLYVVEEYKNCIALLNFEVRMLFFRNLELAYFIDAGNVWDEKISHIKTGMGFGIRIRTPIGPIRIDYGYKLEEELQRGRIYFSFGYLF